MGTLAMLAAAFTFVATILNIKDKSNSQSKMEDRIADKIISKMSKKD